MITTATGIGQGRGAEIGLEIIRRGEEGRRREDKERRIRDAAPMEQVRQAPELAVRVERGQDRR